MRELLLQFAILTDKNVEETVGNCSISFVCLPCFDMSRNASSALPLNKILILELKYTFLKKISFYPYFIDRFYHEWLLNFVKGIFSIYVDCR